MKHIISLLLFTLLLCAYTSCTSRNAQQYSEKADVRDSLATIKVKYATGFSVRDSADVRLVNIGKKDIFALVGSDDVQVPDGYTKVRVPIKNTICMTSLQLSNFTVLDAHDVIKGITGKNLGDVIADLIGVDVKLNLKLNDLKSFRHIKLLFLAP